MAGCGCSKRKKGTQAFVLQRPDGKTTVHATRLEAEAANAREGGKGTVKQK